MDLLTTWPLVIIFRCKLRNFLQQSIKFRPVEISQIVDRIAAILAVECFKQRSRRIIFFIQTRSTWLGTEVRDFFLSSKGHIGQQLKSISGKIRSSS